MESPERTLAQIASLAAAGRAVRIGYRRPGEAEPMEYVVEPYRLHRFPSGPVLHAWQLSPAPTTPSSWRDFRLDRIASATDAGQPFAPRVAVTLAADAAAGAEAVPAPFSDRPIVAVGPADEYFRQLETAMLDAQVTPAEMELARTLGDRVTPEERKAVHARVYANVLNEVARDGRVTHREEIYLRQVRRLLDELGWAP